MNILFITENNISQSAGGTDRITITLSNAFSARGHKCYLAFCRDSVNPENCAFEQRFLLKEGREREVLSECLNACGIDIIVSNLVDIGCKRRLVPLAYELSRKTGARLVACYHAMPGEDLIGNTICNSLWRIRKYGDLKRNAVDMALSIVPSAVSEVLFRKRFERKYRLLYDFSDALVLLSPKFADRYASLAGLQVDGKFHYIGSSLSYDEFYPVEELDRKSKSVIIVSRMDEKSKRLSYALKVWKLVCNDPRCADWNLRIVGGGPDLEYYRCLAGRMDLKNVSIEGRVDDVTTYYRESSIFLMTSAYEGWGLTVTESQQFGVVPVVMDSYASLTDLVTSWENGIIVPYGEVAACADAVKDLMLNDMMRKEIAARAIESSRRFSMDRTAAKWLDLFERLQG